MNTEFHEPYGTVMVSWSQKEGTRHREDKQLSEDAVFLRSDREYLFCGLADGQSGSRYGQAGGKACLEALWEHIASIGIRNFLDAPFPDEHPCSVTRAVRQRLRQLSENRGTPLEEFSSTLLAVAIDLEKGKYALLHLGDGCAVSVPTSGEPVLISQPENGPSLNQTWLTTSENAVSHFRIRFGTLENKKRILLLSDGATCLCRGKNIPWRAKELLKSSDPHQLHQHLLRSEPTDDATCILLECNEKNKTCL